MTMGPEVHYDCGCRFWADDVFHHAPIFIVPGCSEHDRRSARPGAHRIPIAAMPANSGAAQERFFALAKPVQGAITLFFEQGHFDLDIADARLIHSVLGGAIAIYDGNSLIQRQAAAAEGAGA